MALRHVDLSVGRPPGRDWKRRRGRPRACWSDQVRRDSNTWNVVMVLLRLNGPRRLCDHDDDNIPTSSDSGVWESVVSSPSGVRADPWPKTVLF